MNLRRERVPLLVLHVAAVALMAGVLGSFAPAPAQAQGTSVEELERRLQKAKEARAQREAAAAKEREAAEAERKRREAEAARAAAERKAQEARQANLVVQADAPCTLFVNGKETAQLPKGIAEVKVSPGQKLVSCASSEEKVAFDGEIEARSGQDTVLRVTLAVKVAEIRSARAAALEREAQARREAEAKAAVEARAAAEAKAACDRGGPRAMQPFSGGGVLRQCATGLEWTAQDNGRDVNWSEAQSYCRGLGGGWSLPTVEQLQSLYNANLPGISCGKLSCKVSNQFRLSSWWFWSSEPNGSSEAWDVFLFDGSRGSDRVGNRLNGRALCVRRP
jgi:hypothetical protein